MHMTRCLVLLAAGLLVGCEEPPLVGEGEACNSLSDCKAGLVCVEQHCSGDIRALAGAVPTYDEPALDASLDAAVDGSVDAGPMDASAARPDAAANAPDASSSRPDATVTPADAAVRPPDAMVGPPDAMVGPPDATLPDATVPDASLPDADP